MFKIIANDEYGVKTYAIDTESDLDYLPISQANFGSTAFCIDTSEVYMLNSSGKWTKV